MRGRAASSADRLAYVFLADGETEAERLTYADLDRKARAIAATLQGRVRPGDRVLLLFPPGLDFVAAFFGCLYAKAIAVPLYPPRPRREDPRLRVVVRDCSPRAALTTSALAAWAAGSDLPPIDWIATEEIDAAAAEGWTDPGAAPDSVAFLQYTSGSTGDPKGVIVTHGNLLHNEEAIRRTFRQDEDSRIVGWLPLYHDMGLIGNVLQPLWVGAPCILMAPVAFLQRPRRWLEAISRYRATTSGGPDFAYALCARKIAPAEREGLDLSCWRVAFSGAEPVRAATLERFAEAFAPCGFSPRAFHPCYGLAEATLLVSGAGAGEPYRAPAFDAAALGRDRVEPAASGGPAVRLVGNGAPFAEQRVVIADPATGRPCAPGAVGEIWLRSPSVTRGYWNRPEETERAFGAVLPDGDGPFLRTGDLGFLDPEHGGELFVTGRLKDLIILRGRNLYPQDVERAVEGAHPVLRPDGAAAFAVDDQGEERLVLVLEVEPRARGRVSESAGEAARAVREAVAGELEAQVWDVVLIPAGELPRTTSGKVRRRACREKLLGGTLEILARCPLEVEGATAVASAGSGPSAAELRALEPSGQLEALTAWLRAQAARALRVPEPEIDPARPLTSLGLDSLAAVELAHGVETALGTAPALADLLAGATLEGLAAALALRLDEPGQPEGAAAAGPETGDHPLSGGQEALWFLERLAPGSGAYHIAGAARVAAPLDREAFERAVRRLVARHPALRTVLAAPGGHPVQRVLPELSPDLLWEDLSAAGEAAALARLEAEAARPFDLERGPLLRLLGLERPGGEHLIGLTVHHAVADFWSLGVMVRELGALYREETGGAPAALAPLAVRFSDHARREALRLASPAGASALAWWEERLAGAPVLDLPCDRPRPPVQTWRGAAAGLRLAAPAAASAEALAARNGATLFMLLLAGFQALLHRYSGQEDFVVGAPTAGRDSAAFADVVGYFVNPLPLRARLGGDPGFAALLERTRETALAAFAHGEVPFPRIAAALQPERDPARPPVFQTLFVLHRAARPEEEALAAFALGEPGARLDLGGLAASSLLRERRAPQFDLTLAAARLDGELVLSLEHNGDLFDTATAERMLRHLAHLLNAAVADPRAPLSRLPLLAPAEREELLRAAATPAQAVPEACLHELVAEQARRTPEATAVIGDGGDGGARLTYAELVDRAEQLARHLAALGVGPEIPVALAVRRTPDLVCGMLGILAAGGAYVPLDPAYPRERLAYMLEDSGAAALVTEEALLPVLPPTRTPVLRLEDLPEAAGPDAAKRRRPGPGNLAYLIYTSGSTGRPKGVAIEHRSAAALVTWARSAFSPAELAGVLASTSVCFDLSIFEIFVPLACGGTVILAGNALELPRLAAAGEVTLVNTVPSVIAELGDLPSSVRTVCLAGEALLAPLVRRLEAAGRVDRVLNLYGPTEDTTYSTWAEVQGRPAPTIGRPLPGTQAQVLDEGLEPVPPGVVGELWLGGGGLARGYHGRPDLTADRFRPSPWGGAAGEPGARLYRTGDLVRRLCDGELEYLGRSDHQVKIRGFRIELGEIEAALARHPAVRQAAALALPDGPGGLPRLVAWVGAPEAGKEPEAGEALRRELLATLAETLPQALRPQALVVLQALPLTPNGKIDRRALPAPAPAAAAGAAAEPPATPAEELVAEVLAGVLGIEKIGRHENFFAAGGHSLLAARAVARLHRAFDREISLVDLFQAPTVAGLAERLTRGAAETSTAPPLVPVPRDAPLPLSFAQERLWFLHQLDPESAAYHLPGALELTGPLHIPALAAALGEILRRHEALRTRFLVAGERPVQAVAPPPEAAAPPRIDLDALPAEAAEREARRICGVIARRPFDLASPPLARWALLRLGPRAHRLAVVFHHIVSDGASFEVFLRELAALYSSRTAASPAARRAPLAPLPVQLADIAAWQRQALSEEVLRAPLGWWRERLAGLPVLELPTDRPRQRAGSADRGALRAFSLDAAEALRPLCRSEGATLFMALLAAFSALLARLAGQTDVPVGTPISTRDRVETEGLIGLLIDTLVLRADLGGEPTGRELLARVRRTVLEAHAHAGVPFERLVDELNPERTLHHSPLFQAMFAFLHTGAPQAAAGGLEIRFSDVETGTAKFDLSLWARQSGERLGGHLVYRSELWDAATPARWEGYLLALVRGFAEAPDRPLGELPLLSAAERHQIEREWNDTALPVDAGRCLHEIFAARAAAAPDSPALLTAGGALSFRELDRRANRAARRLLALGVEADAPVGLCADRSPESLVALLAIWKAGGAYLPLDPTYPRERLEMVLADAGTRALITRPELLAAPPEVPVLPYSELEGPGAEEDGAAPKVAVPPDSLAYVLYTSGSTGRPKGTLVCHRSVAHLLAALRETVYRELGRGGARLRVGVNASLAFDASVKQIIQLLDGHALSFVPEEDRLDGHRLIAFCRSRGLDVLDCTPSQLRVILAAAEEEGAAAGPLPLLLVGGEAIDEALWRDMAERGRAGRAAGFWNVYGPTECTVDATAFRVEGDRPVLGGPIANVRIHLLDGALRPVPPGVPGELCIAGAGVARGYHLRPDLTALRFAPDPLAPRAGERLYRTGDLARRRPDGRLEFLGREDGQVKVRGFRIELGEIEAALAAHPDVEQAVVALRGPLLVGYTTGAGDPGEEALRAFLARRLPEPMVPARFVRLERFPLNPSGKVDRRALPDPGASTRESVPPRTPVEERIAAVWCNLLGLTSVGVRDSFFALGGHSLLVAQLASRLRQELGVEIPLRRLFEAPTIEEIAATVEAEHAAVAPRPAAIKAQPRGRRNLSQLVGEVGSLSDEQVRARLRPDEGARRRSS